MARSKARPAPARKYVPIINAMEYVTERATTLTTDERTAMLKPARDGFKALREGVATEQQWAFVAGAVGLALSIEAQGIVRGMKEHFTAADLALAAVRKRVQEGVRGSAWGKCTTLYFDEIAAINEAIDLHHFQLRQLAVFELRKAIDQHNHQARGPGALQIHATTRAEEPAPIQESLL